MWISARRSTVIAAGFALVSCTAFGSGATPPAPDAATPDPAAPEAGVSPSAEGGAPDECPGFVFCDRFEREDAKVGWDAFPDPAKVTMSIVPSPDGRAERVLGMTVVGQAELHGLTLSKRIARRPGLDRVTASFAYRIPSGTFRHLNIMALRALKGAAVVEAIALSVSDTDGGGSAAFSVDATPSPAVGHGRVPGLPRNAWTTVTFQVDLSRPNVHVSGTTGNVSLAADYASTGLSSAVDGFDVKIGVDFADPGNTVTVYYDDVTLKTE